MSIKPNNVQSSDADIKVAKAILSSDDQYVVRYLRHAPTVGLSLVPVRNADGAIIEDVPLIKRRVICKGEPYGCLIAFAHPEALRIGWSKRIETRQLIQGRDLRSLYLESLKSTFEEFVQNLVSFLSYNKTKDIEIPFSKYGGKVAAIIRGLNDTLVLTGNVAHSACSGPIPTDVAKHLGWFVRYAERAYGSRAANVSYKGQDLATQSERAVTLT